MAEIQAFPNRLVKSKLRTFRFLVIAALLLGSGFALGWHLRERRFTSLPVSTEITLDAKNRPATLKSFITLSDGGRLLHGKQFIWEWQDHPTGCIVTGLSVRRKDYDNGGLRGFAMWNEPSALQMPEKPISPEILTKYPDER